MLKVLLRALGPEGVDAESIKNGVFEAITEVFNRHLENQYHKVGKKAGSHLFIKK